MVGRPEAATVRSNGLARFIYRPTLMLVALAAFGCSRPVTSGQVLTCYDTKDPQQGPWVVRIDDDQHTAEMIVHVPEESVRIGVPAGNRRGHVVTSERAYSIMIPADSGGSGDNAWVRLQFAFEIDRYSKSGVLQIGKRQFGDTLSYNLRCEPGPAAPPL